MRKEDITEKLSAVSTLNGLDATALELTRHFGMDGYYYINYKPMTGLVRVDHRDKEWVDRYAVLGYEQIDLIPQALFAGDTPFTWDELVEKDTVTAQQIKVRNEAKEFGLSHGYQVISRETAYQGGTCCFFTHSTQDYGDTMRTNKQSMDMLSHLYHEKYNEITVPCEELPKLSPREKECLALAAQGKTNDEIGVILTLSANTVNGYIQSASKKLDVRTKIHAVVRAVQLQIIYPY